jgi:hypothetical protein
MRSGRHESEEDRDEAENKFVLATEIPEGSGVWAAMWGSGEAFRGSGHGTSPSWGKLCKVLEGETLGLDFGWLEWCVKWCSPACAGLFGVWVKFIVGVKDAIVDWKLDCVFGDGPLMAR